MAPLFIKASFLLTTLMSIAGQLRRCPPDLSSHSVAARLRFDPDEISAAANDFGGVVHSPPAAVFFPSSPADIAALVRLSHASPHPFPIAPRGHGHSVRGQAQASGGIVVQMSSLAGDSRIAVSLEGGFVDSGGEQLWIDVLRETLRRGMSPRSWTDYLHLTVGGTLSNGGVGGQAFRHGPQIANVLEMEVITGKGETVTCSERRRPELFFSVLGGVGQFGIITRARIAIDEAPKMVCIEPELTMSRV